MTNFYELKPGKEKLEALLLLLEEMQKIIPVLEQTKLSDLEKLRDGAIIKLNELKDISFSKFSEANSLFTRTQEILETIANDKEYIGSLANELRDIYAQMLVFKTEKTLNTKIETEYIMSDKKDVLHIKPERKGEYGQDLRIDEIKRIVDVLNYEKTPVSMDTKNKNIIFWFDDEKDKDKINKIAVDLNYKLKKFGITNYMVTVGKIEKTKKDDKNYIKSDDGRSYTCNIQEKILVYCYYIAIINHLIFDHYTTKEKKISIEIKGLNELNKKLEKLANLDKKPILNTIEI